MVNFACGMISSHLIEGGSIVDITGTFEYMLRVEVTDLAAYKVFHSKVLGSLPQGNTITTYVVIDSPKDKRG